MVFCFESQNIFFCLAKREIFFQNLTLGYITKTLNQIFFFLHQNQNILFINIGNQNIFLEKKTITPLFKLNGRSLIYRLHTKRYYELEKKQTLLRKNNL